MPFPFLALSAITPSLLLTLESMISGMHDAVDAEPLVYFGLMLLTLSVLLFEWGWAVSAVRRLRVIQQQRSAAVAHAAAGCSVWGWVYTLLGGLLATGGGLMTLGLGISITLGHVEAKDLAAILIGGIVIGILSPVIGLRPMTEAPASRQSEDTVCATVIGLNKYEDL